MVEKYIPKWQAEPFEAIRWTGKNDIDVLEFIDNNEFVPSIDIENGIIVVTNDIGRPLAAKAGDYIAKDSQGYPFVFAKDYFERCYKKAIV